MFEVTTAPGRPKDAIVRHAIPQVLKELGMANPEQIRQQVSKSVGRTVSWNTVNRALEELAAQKIVTKQIVSKGRRRTIIVYSLSM